MTKHAQFGGSNCERWLNCAGSTALLQTVPRRPAGQAAADGTAQHSCMEIMISDPGKMPFHFLDAVVEGVKITADMVKAMDVALKAFEDITEEHPGDIYAEKHVEMTDDAWGTADVVIKHGDHLVVLDWKFGQGVVDAKDNDQGLFYAAAARKTLKLKPKTIEVVIVQPAMDPAIDRHTYTAGQLDTFEVSVIAALKAAKAATPSYREGSWCDWCDAKIACPLKTQRLDTLTPHGNNMQLEQIAVRLALLKSLDPWREAAEERIQHELEYGAAVPGWKLVNKRAVRQWRSEDSAIETLRKHGVGEDKLFKRTPISPAQAEKLVPKKLVEEMSMSVSSGTTIATEDDKRPAAFPVAALKKALGVT